MGCARGGHAETHHAGVLCGDLRGQAGQHHRVAPGVEEAAQAAGAGRQHRGGTLLGADVRRAAAAHAARPRGEAAAVCQ